MVKWLVRDAADQFHGMCSAVFVVNYSWEFGAIWSFIKYAIQLYTYGLYQHIHRHVLPASAKARVIFPTVEELGEYLSEEALPPCESKKYDHQGFFLTFSALNPALNGSCRSVLPYYPSPFPAASRTGSSPARTARSASSTPSAVSTAHTFSVPPPAISRPGRARRISRKQLHPTSHDNSYYGYPTTIEEGIDGHGRPVRFQHSRRRKRDLVRTLMWLLLLRCRERIAHLPWQLQNLARNMIPGKRSILILLTAVVLLTSLHRAKWPHSIRWSLVS